MFDKENNKNQESKQKNEEKVTKEEEETGFYRLNLK